MDWLHFPIRTVKFLIINQKRKERKEKRREDDKMEKREVKDRKRETKEALEVRISA